MNSYEIDLTIAPELNRLDGQMRPFDKYLPNGRPKFAALAIDVDIKHLSLTHLSEPLPKNTAVHHDDGLVLISLPRDLGGYHAKNVLLGQRGINALSFIANNADISGNTVCVSSPSQFQFALEEIIACLNDAASIGSQSIPAEELLMKELRIKAISQDGKIITRFEQLVKHHGAKLLDTDLDITISCEDTLSLAITHRVKKACAMGVNIENLEGRLRDIFMFCTEGVKLDIDREIERAMPGAVPYRTFAEALGYACEGFDVSGDVSESASAAATNEAETAELVLGGDDFVFVDLNNTVSNDYETGDLFESQEDVTPILGAAMHRLVLGVNKISAVVRASIDQAKGVQLEDVVQLMQKGKALAKRLGCLTNIIRSNKTRKLSCREKNGSANLVTTKPKGVGLYSPASTKPLGWFKQFDMQIGVFLNWT
jgi:hypothetical protein